jgi:hypothetical protein
MFFESKKDAEDYRDSFPSDITINVSEIDIIPDSEKEVMKAEILPLDGKYYVSKMEIETKDSEKVFVELYCTDTYAPSERESEEIEPGDNHYERHLTYKVCKRILKCFND